MKLSLILKNDKHLLLLSFGVLIYITYFTLASFLRFDNFYTGRFDLGNMDQTVWNTINGRIFETSDANGAIISRLSGHADFLLILLSPFYLIWSDPKMLLLIQTVVLGFGAFFVYAIAKEIFKNKNIALVFGIVYLLNPAMQHTNLYDFHAVALATTFLLAAFYFLLKNRLILLMIFLILSAIAKEQVWLIVAIFGLYIFFSKKNISYKKLGIFIFAISTFLFYYLVWHAIPNTLGGEHFALSYYSDFGDSPTEIIKNIIASPQKIFITMFSGNPLSYLKQLLYPLGLLSFLAPLFLIFALPDLLINLLSNNPQLHQIYYQYSATITPFIFISAIYGIKNLKKWLPKIPNYSYALYLILTTLYCLYIFGPLPFSKHPNTDMFTKPQKNKIIIEEFISKIPRDYKVAATNNLGSHLSQRQSIATIPEGIGKADVVLFLLDHDFISAKGQQAIIENLKKNRNYKKVFRKDNFIVFEKKVM